MKTKPKVSQRTGGQSVDTNSRNLASKINNKLKNSSLVKNKSIANRSGEFGTANSRNKSSIVKSEGQSLSRGKNLNIKKSPLASTSKKVGNLKKVFNEKNAPKSLQKHGGKKIIYRGRQKLKRKEIEILIETPKLKKEEIARPSVIPSNFSRRGESAKKILIEPVSKSKERMKNLSKDAGEEDEFMKIVKGTNLKPTKEVAKRTGRKIENEEIMKKPRAPSKLEKNEKSTSKSLSDTRKLERSRNKDEKSLTKKNLAKRSFPIKAEKTIKKEVEESPEKTGIQKTTKKQLNNIQPTPIRKVIIKPTVKPKVEVKEEESEESKQSSPLPDTLIKKDESTSKSKERKLIKKPIKHQLGYNVNTKAISEEITKILKKIEDKKKRKTTVEAEVPMKTSKLVKKLSAQDYGFKLKFNPNFKPNHIIKIQEINSKQLVTNSDVLLTIIEIATNSDYYSISYNDRSRFFWEDVVKYEDLKNIFKDYKGETLRKYWKFVSSIGDVNKTSDLVKKHKKLFDEIQMKLLPIIVTIKKYMEGQIDDIETYIRNQTFQVRKTDLFEEVVVDPETGLKKEISYKITTTRNIKKYESKITQEYKGRNFEGPVDDVLTRSLVKPSGVFQNTMKAVNEENDRKFAFLHSITENDKKIILSFNNEEKLMVNIIDKIIDGLSAEFPNFNRKYIESILKASSMNLPLTYNCLKDSTDNKKGLFDAADDAIILTMKGKMEYDQLLKSKGAENVQEREDFLLD